MWAAIHKFHNISPAISELFVLKLKILLFKAIRAKAKIMATIPVITGPRNEAPCGAVLAVGFVRIGKVVTFSKTSLQR